ncbi:acyl-CoA synthetase (AMP-forming)/AMP-acid ligase II [Tepidamorphus gemmatus]|uniref:Acyl-CoA synthetase (AMP-forming)/AMP-acid ligase II n=1 Tax=Tepidamorphus gemmatus TaxID=747076 RepID=A0A4V2UZT1_9HYPH|nr:class I adenylate-forming enzyme family protein [Tepidamorphus gemmatus]TCT12533.1 acyl-CoA synthetase (AMP-forming)/AMP-acid ligase II [Tepidamorphus gemmatus]
MILVDREAADRYLKAEVWGKATLDGLLARLAATRPDDVAVTDPGDRIGWQRSFGPAVTWAEIDRMVSAVAAVLLDAGLKQDDVVGIQLANCVEALVTHLAALRAGLIPAALPITWREMELAEACDRVAPVALVTASRIGPNDHADLMMRVAVQSMSVRHIFAYGANVADGVSPLNPALSPSASTEGANGAPRSGNPADHVAMLTFVSWDGTLEPLARSHNQWLSAAAELALDARIGPDAVLATSLLPTSLTGLTAALGVWLLSGCRLNLVMPTTSAAFCREVARMEATHLVLPGHLTHLVEQLDPRRRLRLVRYWASPDALSTAARDTAGDGTTDVISLDEMAITTGSGGKALVLPLAGTGEEAATDPKRPLLAARMMGNLHKAGSNIVPGALLSGALMVGGPQVPTAAFPGRPSEAEVPFRFRPHPDGFRETGLRCRLVESDGPSLVVLGHRKETIVVGGFVVAAESLDTLYGGFDGFLDAAAASIPDPMFGERIVAAVVPQPGRDCSLAAFRAHLRELGVAAHLMPDRILTVREIPRSADGTILRSTLATSLAA